MACLFDIAIYRTRYKNLHENDMQVDTDEKSRHHNLQTLDHRIMWRSSVETFSNHVLQISILLKSNVGGGGGLATTNTWNRHSNDNNVVHSD